MRLADLALPGSCLSRLLAVGALVSTHAHAEATSVAAAMIPSLAMNPSASSQSCPGVRSVTGNHIVYTGLRPGERLHEELTAPDEETIPTVHAKVRVIRTPTNAQRSVIAEIEEWETALRDGRWAEVLIAVEDYCGGVERATKASPKAVRRLAAGGTDCITEPV